VENLFAHDPFREGKVEETLFEAASALLKYVLVNGHAVPASEIEVNTEEGRVRVAYEGEIIEFAPILEDPSGEFDRTLRALRRARVVKSPPSAIGWRLARVAAGPRPCRPLSVGRDTGGCLRDRLAQTFLYHPGHPGLVGGRFGQGYE
jgi:hypothetical protein